MKLLACLLLALGTACAPHPAPPPPPEPAQLEQLDLGVQRLFRSLAQRVEAVRAGGAPAAAQAAAYGDLGLFHLANGDLGAAEICFRAASDLDPSRAAWLSYRAHVSLRQGRLDEALTLFEQRLARDPGDRDTLLWIAETCLRTGDLERARRALDQALEADPRSHLVRVAMAYVALDDDRPEEARADLDEARRLGAPPVLTDHLAARIDRRLTHRAGADLGGRSRSLAEAIELADPLLLELGRFRVGARQHDLRALAAESEGQLELALVELRQAIAADPDRVFARLDTAEMLLRLGRPEEARSELAMLIERHPDYPPAIGRMAEVEARLGNREHAGRLFARAIELDPLSLPTLLANGEFLTAGGRCGEARSLFERALELDPGSELAAIGLGRCDIDDQDPETAARRLESLLEARPGVSVARLLLSRLLALTPEIEDPARALALARDVRAAHGDLLPVLDTLAMAAAASRDFAGAAAFAVRAAALCDDAPCAERANRRRALYEAGRTPDRALDLDEPLRLPRS